MLHVLVHQTIIVHLNYKSLKTQILLQHAIFLLVRLCIKTIKMCQTRHIFIVLIHNLTSKKIACFDPNEYAEWNKIYSVCSVYAFFSSWSYFWTQFWKVYFLKAWSWPHFNTLKPELNPICYLLALLGVHHFLHVSRIRVKLLTFRLLMSYIYGAPILDVSRPHTTTQHSR